MDNRFTFKDAVYVVLLLAILVMLGLTMLQNDRQWERFAQVSVKLDEQTQDLASLRRLIGAGGGAVRPSGVAAPAEASPVFDGLRQAKGAEDYATGDWLVDTFASAPPKLNPITAQDIYARVVGCRVMEPLAVYDTKTLKLVPLLARSWALSEDGTSLTVELRPDVVFSDGRPMTADDVVYSWALNQNPNIADGRVLEYLRFITRVEKIDDHTVRFHFGQVFFENVDRALGVDVLPKHFFEKFTEQEVRDNPALLIGTGPYRLPDPTSYTPGEQIELVRNERYWGEAPAFDRLVYRLIESDAARQVAFGNGEIDVFAAQPEQHLQMLKDEALLARTRHFVYEHLRSGYMYIAWNQRRGDQPTVFADKRVRQAMTLMLDRQRIVDEVYLGFADVATGPFSPLGPQADGSIEPWPYDPARGVALLKEAGFTVGADGVMRKPDGARFEVTLTYPAGSDFYQKIMLLAKDWYARAGVPVTLDPQEWSILLESINTRNFDAITLGWGAGGVESDIEQMFHSRTIAEGDNRNSYSSAELDALIDEAHVTMDTDARMALWKRCHAVLHEDQPYTFLTRPRLRVWLDDRIANVRLIPPLGLNYVQTWPLPVEWYVPKQKQERGRSAP